MIKKLLLLNLFYFLFSVLFSFSFSEDELSNIEFSRYGRNFTSESISERLARLETDMLGMAQNGNIESRIDTLSRIGNNINSFPIVNPYENMYYSRKKSPIKRFWNNITSAFDDYGTVTGFTPPINGTNYGYTNNIYRDSLFDFANNPNSYCPYHNRYNNYHNRHRYGKYNDNRYINHNPYNHNRIVRNASYNNRFNRYGRNYMFPTDINRSTIAKSSVHILQD